jgi:hypothetical protein
LARPRLYMTLTPSSRFAVLSPRHVFTAHRIQLEKETIQAEISRTSAASLHPPLDETGLIHELIAQYLAHDGYVETARAFADEVRVEAKALANGDETGLKDLNPEEDVDAINRQSKLTPVISLGFRADTRSLSVQE